MNITVQQLPGVFCFRRKVDGKATVAYAIETKAGAWRLLKRTTMRPMADRDFETPHAALMWFTGLDS